MAEVIPDFPYELPAEPMALIQEMLPRIVPTLLPRYSSLLTHLTLKTRDYTGTLPDGTTINVPGVTLTPKLISSSVSPEGDLHEYYLYVRGGDPEAFVDLWKGPTVTEGLVQCSISRSCGATLDVLFDGQQVKEMPQGSDIGYFGFAFVLASGEMVSSGS